MPALNDLSPSAWPPRHPGLDLGTMVVAYAVLTFLAIYVGRQPGTLAPIWLANGVAIALIVSTPQHRIVGMFVAAAAGDFAAHLACGDTLTLSLAFLTSDMLEIALGVFLVNRTRCAEKFANDHISFFRVVLAGAFFPPLLGATVSALTLQTLEFAEFSDVWIDRYIGVALGSVATLPLVLTLRTGTATLAFRQLRSPWKVSSAVIVAIVSLVSFRSLPYPFPTIDVMLMLLAFLRPRLATFICMPVMVSTMAVAAAFGWFVPPVSDSSQGHALVYFSAMLTVVLGQTAAVVITRQRTLSQMLAAIGSRADDIIVFLDMNGVYRWVNEVHQTYWGIPDSRVLGRSSTENLPAGAHASLMQPLLEQARAGARARYRTEIDYPLRGRRTMDILTQPSHDEDGHQNGILFCATDVTELEASRRELRHMADQLEVSNQNLEQFVRIASHDLREPLNTIVQFCDLIASSQGERLDDSGKLYFTYVRNGSARMRSMLDDVLQYIRLDEKQNTPSETVDLDALVDDVIAALKSLIDASKAKISVTPLGSAQGHPMLLSLVVQNFLSNALKFVAVDRAPVIEIGAFRSSGQLRLTVADNGIGIDTTKTNELGTPFRRLHARRKFEGTGLGLAICKRIAEQHGGRIEIESQIDLGSQFSLIIPDL